MLQVLGDFFPELLASENTKVPSVSTVQRARKAMKDLNNDRTNQFVSNASQLTLMVDQSPSLDGVNMNGTIF